MKGKANALAFSLVLVLVLAASGGAAEYHEAPMLAEQVEAGILPPVEERLPVEPFVVGPGVLVAEEDVDFQVGRYGGTLITANSVPDWNPDLFLGIREPILRAPGITSEDLVGNVVQDFSVSEDNTEFSFTLREGLKWSDGEPVTIEDVRFVFEDMYLNEEITPVYPHKFRSPSGEPAEFEVVDDMTFRLTFDEPYGAFLTAITIQGWAGYQELMVPSHYMKQFHIDYTTLDELRPYLDEEELEDEWYELFGVKLIMHWDLTNADAVGFPTLEPWMAVDAPSGVLAFERNPYYFKVDTEGNQLPYIDRLETHEVTDTEMVTMRVITGDVDLLREDTALTSMPLYRENEERGGYVTVPLEMHVDPTMLVINYTFADDGEIWQEITQDIRFRQAVNLAIDRDELIDSLYFGMASKPSWIPVDYDLDEANRLLDEMGLDERDSDGFRLRPDGEVFELFLEVGDYAPDFIPAAELAVEYLQDIGIYAHFRQVSTELVGQKDEANQLMGTIAWAHSPAWPWLWEDYLPGNWGWGADWQLWYNTDGESGSTPPDWILEVYDIHEEIIRTVPGTSERVAAEEALHSWYYDNIPIFMFVEEATYPYIVSADLRNVPHSGMATAANLALEQYFFVE